MSRVCHKTTEVANKSQQISELHTTAVSGSSKHGLSSSTLAMHPSDDEMTNGIIDLFGMFDDFITCIHVTLVSVVSKKVNGCLELKLHRSIRNINSASLPREKMGEAASHASVPSLQTRPKQIKYFKKFYEWFQLLGGSSQILQRLYPELPQDTFPHPRRYCRPNGWH